MLRIADRLKRVLWFAFLTYGGLVAAVFFLQRSLIYYPTNANPPTRLQPWLRNRSVIGYCREVDQPNCVWLMTHGNAGEAASRSYILDCIPAQDSVFVLEYPGYGNRQGKASRSTINAAAREAFDELRSSFPETPVCVFGESIGSGPACFLAHAENAPDKIVLVVPFNTLADVAAEHFPFLPVRLLLLDDWDNGLSLQGYQGAVEIYGATQDEIIPVTHARALADRVPSATLVEIPTGHNTWSSTGLVNVSF